MATRKQIINDWQQLFPELKKTGLLSLDNRLGPLITGIYGFISSALPQRAEPYSMPLRYFFAFLPFT